METFMSPNFSNLLSGFQCSLLHMIELWRNVLDQKKKTDAIFLDISKAYNTIEHGLLIAKLSAYGFSVDLL